MTKRSDTVWTFVFIGVTDHLSGGINRFEITVAAEWAGGAWDLIFDLDAYPMLFVTVHIPRCDRAAIARLGLPRE